MMITSSFIPSLVRKAATPLSLWFLFTFVFAGISLANEDSGITISVDTRNPGRAISEDFAGLSFETLLMLPDSSGVHYFRPDNRPLLTLFHTLGIKSLRIGGNTGDRDAQKLPDHADIDSLFGFAKAAGVKVIYCLRLHNGDPQEDAPVARYIMDHYEPLVDCFSIGQEPSAYPVEKLDTRPSSERMGAAVEKYSYPRFIADWHRFADAIIKAVPNVRFSGPGVHHNAEWPRRFMSDFDQSAHLDLITVHLYPGGAGGKVKSPESGRDRLLSDEFDRTYQQFYEGFGPAAISKSLPYRLEEANNFYNGGAADVSNTYASALWGLDFMWWWASHHARGVNFHTGDRVAAGNATLSCKYAAFYSTTDGYKVQPLGYGIKTFDVGSHGRIVPVKVSGSAAGGISAYAVISNSNDLLVTVINKNHGATALDRDVTLLEDRACASAQTISMLAPGGDVSATSGITVGGAKLADDGSWAGAFTPLPGGAAGPFRFKLTPASAVVVKLKMQ